MGAFTTNRERFKRRALSDKPVGKFADSRQITHGFAVGD